jgi:hypothetical protein
VKSTWRRSQRSRSAQIGLLPRSSFFQARSYEGCLCAHVQGRCTAVALSETGRRPARRGATGRRPWSHGELGRTNPRFLAPAQHAGAQPLEQHPAYRMARRGRGRTTRPATGGRSRRPAPTSATAALSVENTGRSWWSGDRAAGSIRPPAVTRTRVGYGSEVRRRTGRLTEGWRARLLALLIPGGAVAEPSRSGGRDQARPVPILALLLLGLAPASPSDRNYSPRFPT